MTVFDDLLKGQDGDSPEIVPALEELCRDYDVSLELIEKSNNLDELLDFMLDEYEKRLSELPYNALDNLEETVGECRDDPRLRSLIMFSSQAAALKVKAESATALREANQRLSSALGEAEAAKEGLRGVMEALDVGIMILDAEGNIQDTNAAVADLTGRERGDLVGTGAAPYLGDVAGMSNGDVKFEIEGGFERTCLLTRRNLERCGKREVVLLNDVTERDRAAEERYESEKMEEILGAVAVLAHKINNPLTALLGRAQLLRARVHEDPYAVKATRVIEESAVRIAGLIKYLARITKDGSREELQKVIAEMKPGDGPSGKGVE